MGKKHRTERIAVYLEPEIHIAVTALAEVEGRNLSDLVRSILLKELRERQLMPDATLARLAGAA